jgi:hypothetical protein
MIVSAYRLADGSLLEAAAVDAQPDGSSVVEAVVTGGLLNVATDTDLLVYAKDRAHARRRALRTEAELGGFTHGGHRFDSDRDSILRIANAAQAATVASMLQMPFATVWTCADGYQYDVPDAATMLAIHGALVAHGQACHSYSQALADLIEGAVSLEALAAMDLSAGWPG